MTAMSRPYDDAPRLPPPRTGGGRVELEALVRGAWIELEIGPGRGGFLFERAVSAPEAALLGLEIRRKWAALVDARLAKMGLGGRGRVFAEDAKLALAHLGPDASVRRVFVHFPDPWWKKRHQKRMVVGDVLVGEIARLLEPSGELFLQTDVSERAEAYEQRLALDPRFVPAGDEPGSPRLSRNPYGARSNRERRADADGIPVFRLRYTRAPPPSGRGPG
jgi:tRNA (guanine-N7-)-methyltransferase